MVLQQPYPFEPAPGRKIVLSFAVGVFVFLFLAAFQPFGLSEWQTAAKHMKLLGYGGVTTTAMLLNYFFLPALFPSGFRDEAWKVWKEIAWVLWTILLIATGNVLYSNYLRIVSLSLGSFAWFVVITLLIGLFPCTLLTLLNYNRLLRRNRQAAGTLNQVIEEEPVAPAAETEMMVVVAENGKDKLEFPEEELLYMASADNYTEIYLEREGKEERHILRITLKAVEARITGRPYLCRCHRSYLVNLKRVTHVSGNSQGYKLHLSGTEFRVPVSRNLNETVTTLIAHLHGKD